MELGIPLHVRVRRVLVCPAKMTGDGDLAFGGEVLEVLVAEDEDLALGSVECEFVQPRFGELRDLDTRDLGSKVGAEVTDFCVLIEEIGLCLVGEEPLVGEFWRWGEWITDRGKLKSTYRRLREERISQCCRGGGSTRGTKGPLRMSVRKSHREGKLGPHIVSLLSVGQLQVGDIGGDSVDRLDFRYGWGHFDWRGLRGLRMGTLRFRLFVKYRPRLTDLRGMTTENHIAWTNSMSQATP